MTKWEGQVVLGGGHDNMKLAMRCTKRLTRIAGEVLKKTIQLVGVCRELVQIAGQLELKLVCALKGKCFLGNHVVDNVTDAKTL